MDITNSKTTDKLKLLVELAAHALSMSVDLSKIDRIDIEWVDMDEVAVPNIHIKMKD